MNDAENYLEAHELQTRDAADVIEEFSDEISRMNGECLDIGCGPGSVTQKLLLPRLPKDAHVVGSDISKSMIETAKEEYSEEKRLSFIELDIETKELPSNLIGSFDNAASFYCLHWCQNIKQAFENIYKLLRPGGESLVLFLANNNGFDSYLSLYEDQQYKPYMKDVAKFIPYFHRCDNPRAVCKKMLEESGFEVLHCSCREKTFLYKSLQTLKKHVKAINPFLSRMPKDLRNQFENDFLNSIVNRKISFIGRDNGYKEEVKVLDRYHVLIAHFKKPIISSIKSVLIHDKIQEFVP